MAYPWESDPLVGGVDPNALIEPGNIDLNNRPVVNNPDGTVSTELSFSIGTDKGEVLIPQVVNGRVISKEDAIAHYKQTGENLGTFRDINSANNYAEAIHNRGQPQPWLSDLTPDQALSLEDIWSAANQPLIHAVPRPFPESNPEDSTLAAIGKGAANLPSDVLNFLQSPAGIITAVGGAGLPAVAQRLMAAGFSAQQAIQAVNARTPQERYEALFGAGLAGLGAAKGLKGVETPVETATEGAISPPSASEAAPDVQTPPVAQNANNGRIEPITARIADKPWLSDAEAEAVNAENAPSGEAPAPDTSTAVADQVPNVRQAISLDELRLMRERDDLEKQSDLAKIVGGASHPDIDARLGEIQNELDDIANSRAAAPFEPVPEGVNQEIRANEADRLARAQEDATFRPENEPRPLDEAVTRSPEGAEGVGQPAGQRTSTPQQSAGLGAGQQPQAGAAIRAASPPPSKIGVAEAYANAELGNNTVIPGEGKTWQEARDFGAQYINERGDPRLPIRRAKTSQRVGWQDVGIVSAEYERLAAERRVAASQLAKDPTNPALLQNYYAAEKAQVAWRREMQPVLTKASDALRAAQGERKVNTTDFNDLMDYAIQNMGKNIKDVTPAERTAIAKLAKGNQAAEKARVESADRVRAEVRRQSGGRTMSLEELVKQSEDFFKKATADCVV